MTAVKLVAFEGHMGPSTARPGSVAST